MAEALRPPVPLKGESNLADKGTSVRGFLRTWRGTAWAGGTARWLAANKMFVQAGSISSATATADQRFLSSRPATSTRAASGHGARTSSIMRKLTRGYDDLKER